MPDRTSCYVEFERMGEASVRRLLAEGRLNEWKVRFARHWLAERERARNSSSQDEQIAIARSAKDAAWEAARAAKSANTIATLALIAAAIAIAVSILAIFVR